MKSTRRTKNRRNTKETKIFVDLNLDGRGNSKISTGIRFLDHMIQLFAKHGLFDIKLIARGDTDIDIHHTNEDIGIVLGEAFRRAIGAKTGILRYGSAFVPMDESLSRVRVALDVSGRSSLFFTVPKKVNAYFVYRNYTIHDAKELIKSFVLHAGINAHIDILKGDDPHHILESIFKAWGRAMRDAVRIDDRISGVLSTKGLLE